MPDEEAEPKKSVTVVDELPPSSISNDRPLQLVDLRPNQIDLGRLYKLIALHLDRVCYRVGDRWRVVAVGGPNIFKLYGVTITCYFWGAL